PRDLPPLDPELADWLTEAPRPAMPDAVWDRLSAALAEESARRSAGDVPTTPVVSLAEARSGQGGTRALWPILAGAAGVVLVGAVAIPVLRGGDSAPVADAPPQVASAGEEGAVASSTPSPRTASDTRESTAPASPAPSPTDTPPEAEAPELPAPEGSASEVAGDPDSTSSPDPGSAAGGEPSVVVPMVIATGSEYTADSLADQVTALLAGAGMAEPAALVAAMESPANLEAATPVGSDGFTSSPDVLRTCLDLLGATHGGAAPLVVDRALFSGQDVGVVVRLREIALGQPADLDVLVVDPACTPEDVAAAERFDLALPL
ncbi:MAG: hypothetical protein ACKOT0_08195, partial [bacterium]